MLDYEWFPFFLEDSTVSEREASVLPFTWSDFHAGSRFACFTIPEEKRGLLVVTAHSFLYFSGAKKSEDWMNSGMTCSHSQSRCPLICTTGRVGRDPLYPLCLKKRSSLHLGSHALAFDDSCGTCCQFWIKSRSSESPYI